MKDFRLDAKYLWNNIITRCKTETAGNIKTDQRHLLMKHPNRKFEKCYKGRCEKIELNWKYKLWESSTKTTEKQDPMKIRTLGTQEMRVLNLLKTNKHHLRIWSIYHFRNFCFKSVQYSFWRIKISQSPEMNKLHLTLNNFSFI